MHNQFAINKLVSSWSYIKQLKNTCKSQKKHMATCKVSVNMRCAH